MRVYFTYTNGKRDKIYYSKEQAANLMNALNKNGFSGHARSESNDRICYINFDHVVHIGIYED